MKIIQINSNLSSGLRSDYNLINTIEIEDKPFAVGGFGEVYHCISINGTAPFTKQVVKLFIDNSKGSAEHNFRTTQRLQKKVEKENQKLLSQQGKSLIELFPAFKGLPHCSFRGNLNGKTVIGFVSDNLVRLGFTDFEHFLQDANLLTQYQNFPIERKMLIAFQLVSAFKVLEEFHFIHADLKPGALFINLKSDEIAVIDFDSGVITETVDDEPTCWGAANDWVAPEIWEQQSTIQKGERIKVDIYSDRWSVAIGIHYLMTTFHPLFYLTELSPRISKQYFTPQNQWPLVNKTAPYFQKANEAIYDQYLPWVNSVLPKVVKDKLSHTINFGYKNPVARTSYSDWKIALQAIQEPPKIKVFKSDKSTVINSMTVELSWEVENAHTIIIDNGIGDVTGTTEIKVRPEKNITYHLKAIGHFGQEEKTVDITIFPTPLIESLKVPSPDFNSRLNLNPLNITAPKINISINLESAKFTELPSSFTKLNDTLKQAKPLYIREETFWSISEVFNKIKKSIQQ
jgi:serine/threonine protein kinase